MASSADGAFALKLALPGSQIERLVREADALASCSHGSVATLIEAVTFKWIIQDIWVVREEYLSGGTLEAKLENGSLEVDDVRHLGQCLADVLTHLHPKRLVHRDIKPANIMFRDDGRTPVLTDFGVVRMLDAKTLTADFAARGPCTPHYAAPEQLNNETKLIDWRTDQFCLAIVMCECLGGQHPFYEIGMLPHEIVGTVAARGSLPAATQQTLHARGFGALVRALEPWPVKRFRLPAEFRAALNIN